MPSVSRRSLLASSAALAAGTALLTDIVNAQNNPAEQAVDRGSDLKISHLRGRCIDVRQMARGVEIDESQFKKLNVDPKHTFEWPTPALPDGAVQDYLGMRRSGAAPEYRTRWKFLCRAPHRPSIDAR